ncbi:lipase secretion chaperone [Acidovorax sp. SUPP3334]|uniref:lipase secretion chaperone n=1 Tax=Acidovorax sp. SUPP3334 TaxID=2920881 RepID=UPI0023DE3E4C|nr:lipase secretion chaperone [Acidovorax sp. SUPP3334]GKT21976.1 hypothetical protein AVHM3334_06715 [Acidovorax sp. SUPP3334]
MDRQRPDAGGRGRGRGRGRGLFDPERARHRSQRRGAQAGAQAAERLAQLDGQEQQWQLRLGQYQAAIGSAAAQGRLAQLRDELFTPQEQLRLNAALALRAQSGAAAP